MVEHDWRQGIIVVNWHALAVEDFLELWGNYLVWPELDDLTIQCSEINY